MNYKDLNDQQSLALYQTEGPLLILAGAGSGKTKVVTNKIAYLIEEKKVFPSEILAITFTNKAAKEMKDRVELLLQENISSMWIGTFHSICLRILTMEVKKTDYRPNFSIYDRSDQLTLIKDCLKELDLNKDLYKFRSVLEKISEAKNDFMDPETFISINETDFYLKNIGEIYKLYEKKLGENNALDFDDLILKTIKLLDNNIQVRDYYRDKFKYIFVDEYQDTNKAQYKLIKLFCRSKPNITAVGDNDQSIYKWRGADISNILNFEKDFKEAKVILLEQNYRSGSKILKAANELIKNNTNRKDKKLWTAKENCEDVIYKSFDHSTEEEYGVVNKIQQLNYKGYNYEDMAILYRTNAQSRGFEEALVRETVPYKIVGGLRFYDRKEIKDIISYLTLVQNSDDNISLRRIINEPKRGIGQGSLEKLTSKAEELNLSIFNLINNKEILESLKLRPEKNIKSFVKLINKLKDESKNKPIDELINDLITESGYLDELERENTIESRTRIENIKELVSTAVDYEKREPLGTLDDFLSNISLLSNIDESFGDRAVKLMTVHAAKGLEFKVVFLVGMEENLFPISRSLENDEDIEEERRLCYVAITRAEELLFISSAKNRTLYGKTNPTLESRFILEMGDTIKKLEEKPKYSNRVNNRLVEIKDFTDYNYRKTKEIKKTDTRETQDVKVGDKVFHKLWKQGMVVSKIPKGEDFEIVVAFDNKGLKRLMLSMAPIKVVK
ncbi:ATP-dependent helicase [Peptoniphilus catoniae]|uniref:ATP-dependent helicase n=1 Tax=Peptoniphilus catoniae TaxID=1660341 RepID=UPI0010FD36D6|nr:UvrD-helicase domain-containing protein [Peptoniphilus catoniae]